MGLNWFVIPYRRQLLVVHERFGIKVAGEQKRKPHASGAGSSVGYNKQSNTKLNSLCGMYPAVPENQLRGVREGRGTHT